MGQKKTCKCCDQSKTNKIAFKKAKPNRDISLKLVRIEDDSNLLKWISNNLKTNIDFKLSENMQQLVSIKNKVQHNQQCEKQSSVKKKKDKIGKTVDTESHFTTQQPALVKSKPYHNNIKRLSNKQNTIIKLHKKQNLRRSLKLRKSLNAKLKRINNGHKIDKSKDTANNNKKCNKKERDKSKIGEVQVKLIAIDQEDLVKSHNVSISTTSDLSFDFIDTTSSPVVPEEKESKTVHCKSVSFIDTTSTADISILNSPESDCVMEPENVVAVKIAGACSPNNICDDHKDTTDISDFKNLPCKNSNNASLDLEESLVLISKLTGYNVHPSKVEVLPLPSCNVDLPDISFTENIPKEQTVTETEPEPPSSSSPEVSNQNKNSSDSASAINSDAMNGSKEGSMSTEVRTIYDVMNDVATILPSWNLHILPDTNTFCIGQVTRNKFGIPHLSKCIEVDSDFNAKVYIYQKHCKKFDGVYDSEDSVTQLINRVDHFY